jgi:hypothetical protein
MRRSRVWVLHWNWLDANAKKDIPPEVWKQCREALNSTNADSDSVAVEAAPNE